MELQKKQIKDFEGLKGQTIVWAGPLFGSVAIVFEDSFAFFDVIGGEESGPDIVLDTAVTPEGLADYSSEDAVMLGLLRAQDVADYHHRNKVARTNQRRRQYEALRLEFEGGKSDG